MERFAIGGVVPKNFDIKTRLNKMPKRKEMVQHIVQKLKTEQMRANNMKTQMFLMTDEKVRMQSLTQFLRQYNYYVNKLLLARVDPFIEKKSKQYLQQLDFNKLDKVSNVFNRLTEDAKLQILDQIQTN